MGGKFMRKFKRALAAMLSLMMFIAFIAYFVISLPLGYLFAFVADWGLVGIWAAFPFGLTTAGLLFWLRFRRKTMLHNAC